MSEHTNLVQRRRAELQESVGDLGRMVIDALNRSMDALETHDPVLAERIVAADSGINRRRRLLEQECLVTLAAYKPAGVDLRAIGACMELVSELERIGDYAADVARILLRSRDTPFPREPVEAILEIAGDAIAMLGDTLDAFTGGWGAQRARASAAREEQVDRKEHALVERVIDRMQSTPGFAVTGTYLLWIVHNYERVADRATNIAERAVYVACGEMPDLN